MPDITAISALIISVGVLVVSVGIFYLVVKLGRAIEALVDYDDNRRGGSGKSARSDNRDDD